MSEAAQERGTQFGESIDVLRLERGDVISLAHCPFPLPSEPAWQTAMREASSHERRQDNVSFRPAAEKWRGLASLSAPSVDAFKRSLCQFQEHVLTWLDTVLPRYRLGRQVQRVTFHPYEEATRQLRPDNRNDLIHLDALADPPTLGRRILRVFVNLSPNLQRVWLTSDPFSRLLEKYGSRVGLPGRHGDWAARVRDVMPRLLGAKPRPRSDYDDFMLRMHRFLKLSDAAQDKGVKRVHKFPPGSLWLAMTDACSHAVLRGQFAMDVTLLVSPEVLALPEESPAALLAQATGQARFPRAA